MFDEQAFRGNLTDADGPAAPEGRTSNGWSAGEDRHRQALDVLCRAVAQTGTAHLALLCDGSEGIVDPAACRVVWVNSAALDTLQTHSDDLLGGSLPDLALAAGLPGSASMVAEPEWVQVVIARLAGAAGRWEYAVVTRLDGSRQPVQVRVTAVRLPDGRQGWVVALHEFTPSEQLVEQVRREAEHRFRAVADYAPVGIAMSDGGLRLGFVNDCFAYLLECTINQLVGVGWLTAVDSPDLPALQEALQVVLSGTCAETTIRVMPSQAVARLADSDPATPRWLQFRLAPITTPREAAGFIAIVEDVTSRRAREAHLAYHASRDTLTGLLNRRSLLDRLTRLTGSRRADDDRRFAVLFCDLDGFKRVNDELGHHAGDQVLVEVARRLGSVARDGDVIARLAGDEFVVILHGLDTPVAARSAARRYLNALCAPIQLTGQLRPLYASVGVALHAHGDTADGLLEAADHAMYQAKAAGPGNYRIATREHRALLSDVVE